jgi:putative transposase
LEAARLTIYIRPDCGSIVTVLAKLVPKRGRLWLAEGSCIRLRPEHRNHVWSYDFVEDRTHDGCKYRMLNVLDEFNHECLAIRVARKLKAMIDVLSDLFILRGVLVEIFGLFPGAR